MIQNSDLSQFHSISDQIQMHCKKLLYLTHMDWHIFLVSAVHMGWSQVELKQPDQDSRKGGSQSTSKA